MNELDFVINDSQVISKEPFEGVSSTDLFEENVRETFSAVAAFPVTLPPGLVYVGDKQSLIIFERPPIYKKITYNINLRDNASRNTNKSVVIPIPWQIYVGEFGTNGVLNALHMYFALSEIVNLHLPDELTIGSAIEFFFKEDAHLCRAALPNIYETNLLCLDKETYHPENPNLASKMNLMYASVWDTVFNADVTNNVQRQLDYIHGKGKKRKAGFAAYSSDGSLDKLFKYWQRFSVERVLAQPGGRAFFAPCGNHIQLSEHFISTNTHKFFNTLQKIL